MIRIQVAPYITVNGKRKDFTNALKKFFEDPSTQELSNANLIAVEITHLYASNEIDQALTVDYTRIIMKGCFAGTKDIEGITYFLFNMEETPSNKSKGYIIDPNNIRFSSAVYSESEDKIYMVHLFTEPLYTVTQEEILAKTKEKEAYSKWALIQ